MASKIPMNIQLKDLIKEKIETGIYKYGELIPSERELAATYGLNRMTVRNAISKLVDEGLLKKVRGKGTFVTNPKIQNDLYRIQGFGKMLLDKGIIPSTKVLYTKKRKAGYKYSKIFNIKESDYIYRIIRLRLGNNEPISIEDTFVPYGIIKNIEKSNFEVYSLYDLFLANNTYLAKGYETLTLVNIDRSIAKLLNLPLDSAVFLNTITVINNNDKVVEYTKSYISGEKCSFYNDLV
ncbi:GntR family transcriptional regulator [Clostridium neuense]|uniref:GntR family transcriptional regulator n=1 Tax=Clostridium neuense TaxID=1728934 RepID=A0ABW8THX8_9CLOT